MKECELIKNGHTFGLLAVKNCTCQGSIRHLTEWVFSCTKEQLSLVASMVAFK